MSREEEYYWWSEKYKDERKSYGVNGPYALGEIADAYYEGMCKADETMIPTVKEAARNLLLQYDGNIDIEKFVDDLIDIISK